MEVVESVIGYCPTLVDSGIGIVALHCPEAFVPDTLVKFAVMFTVPIVATMDATSDPYTTAHVLTVSELPTTTELGVYVPLLSIGAAVCRPTVNAPVTVGLDEVLLLVSTAVMTKS